MERRAAVSLLLLALAPACLAHTFFKAEMVPFGNLAPDSPDAAALLDFLIHEGTAYWKLNVTDVEGMKAAKIVFGNPDVTSDEVLTVLDLGAPQNTTAFFQGSFNATDFASPAYEAWTMDTFGANAGLNHIWAIVQNGDTYNNILLAAPVLNYKPPGSDK